MSLYSGAVLQYTIQLIHHSLRFSLYYAERRGHEDCVRILASAGAHHGGIDDVDQTE